MKLRTIALAATLTATAVTGGTAYLFTHAHTNINCTQILPDADHDHTGLVQELDLAYGGDGIWRYPDGSIFSYATYEDSINYNRPGCTPDYITD